MNPVNIYFLSRIREKAPFSILQRRLSGVECAKNTSYHEMESLRILVDYLMEGDLSIQDFDGFFYSYTIPRIGKEFDLLKISDKVCLNVELKSSLVSKSKIINQLKLNKYYLSHLNKKLFLFTVITSTKTCYALVGGELKKVKISQIKSVLNRLKNNYLSDIDSLFMPDKYLVSPFLSPEKFISNEYFLTQAQNYVKSRILALSKTQKSQFILLKGRAGTGKTLLIYDLAKTFSLKGKTLIITFGKFNLSQATICAQIKNLNIMSMADISAEMLDNYTYILVDEGQRLSKEFVDKISDRLKNSYGVCVFSGDKNQPLNSNLKVQNLDQLLSETRVDKEFTLSEKIRVNRPIGDFIECVMDQNYRRKPTCFNDISLLFANTTSEAQEIISYHKQKGYVFLNYSSWQGDLTPYSDLQEPFDLDLVVGKEYDKVIVVIDQDFYYDKTGKLHSHSTPEPNSLFANPITNNVVKTIQTANISGIVETTNTSGSFKTNNTSGSVETNNPACTPNTPTTFNNSINNPFGNTTTTNQINTICDSPSTTASLFGDIKLELFYQSISRVRNKLCLLTTHAPDLFAILTNILK